MKVNNFSAGPSKIPDTVVNQISTDILNYQKLGYSVLEISHRSKVFEEILAKVKSHLYELLKIPDNFDIFFLQGGATFQNTFGSNGFCIFYCKYQWIRAPERQREAACC